MIDKVSGNCLHLYYPLFPNTFYIYTNGKQCAKFFTHFNKMNRLPNTIKIGIARETKVGKTAIFNQLIDSTFEECTSPTNVEYKNNIFKLKIKISY